MWLIILSDQLPVFGLVGRYPTNYLIGRKALPKQELTFIKLPFLLYLCRYSSLCGITPGFPGLSPSLGQVLYVLRTRSPLNRPCGLLRSTCMFQTRR